MIPDVAALGQEAIDFAPNERNRRDGARRPPSRTSSAGELWIVVHRVEHRVGERRRRTDLEASRLGLLAGPGRLEGTATSGRPPAASQRRSGDDRDLPWSRRTSRAIWTRQFGSPLTEERVPSIGSRIQTRSDSPSRPSSSPRNAFGRAADSVSRSSRSTAWSASVTGVPSAFSIADSARLEVTTAEFRRPSRRRTRAGGHQAAPIAADATHRAPAPAKCR